MNSAPVDVTATWCQLFGGTIPQYATTSLQWLLPVVARYRLDEVPISLMCQPYNAPQQERPLLSTTSLLLPTAAAVLIHRANVKGPVPMLPAALTIGPAITSKALPQPVGPVACSVSNVSSNTSGLGGALSMLQGFLRSG